MKVGDPDWWLEIQRRDLWWASIFTSASLVLSVLAMLA